MVEQISTDAVTYVDQGIALNEAGNHQEAIAAFDAAILLNPTYARAFNARGVAHVELDNLDQAVADYTTALKLDSTMALAYYNRGNAYTQQGDVELAIGDYTFAVRLSPSDAAIHFNLGLAHKDGGYFKAAIEDFTKALSLGDDGAETYYQRGLCSYEHGQNEPAVSDFSMAIQLGQQGQEVYFVRAMAYGNLKQFDNALLHLKTIMAHDPNDAHDARILYLVEKLEAAKRASIVDKPAPVPLQEQVRKRLPVLVALVLALILSRLSVSVRSFWFLQWPVTFVHESGHGLSAILTGGHFIRFQVYADGSGVATTAGGFRFIVLQMGYLGAALFGAVLLVLANRTPNTKPLARGIGLYFAACTTLFMDSRKGWAFPIFVAFGGIVLTIFTQNYWRLMHKPRLPEKEHRRHSIAFRVYGVLTVLVFVIAILLAASNLTAMQAMFHDPTTVVGLALTIFFLVLGIFATHPVNVFVLNVLAFSTGFNALNDIFFLTQYQNASLQGTPNDALALAQLTNVSVNLWITVWIILAILMMLFAAVMGVMRPKLQTS